MVRKNLDDKAWQQEEALASRHAAAVRGLTATNIGQQAPNIWSGSDDPFLAALTNPTEISKRKGKIQQDYPIEYGGKMYPSAEAAYQDLKGYHRIGPDRDMFMQSIVEAKLKQHPRLTQELTKRGGVDYLQGASHVVNGRASGHWEGYGMDSGFLKALSGAYQKVTGQTAPAAKGSDGLTQADHDRIFAGMDQQQWDALDARAKAGFAEERARDARWDRQARARTERLAHTKTRSGLDANVDASTKPLTEGYRSLDSFTPKQQFKAREGFYQRSAIAQNPDYPLGTQAKPYSDPYHPEFGSFPTYRMDQMNTGRASKSDGIRGSNFDFVFKTGTLDDREKAVYGEMLQRRIDNKSAIQWNDRGDRPYRSFQNFGKGDLVGDVAGVPLATTPSFTHDMIAKQHGIAERDIQLRKEQLAYASDTLADLNSRGINAGPEFSQATAKVNALQQSIDKRRYQWDEERKEMTSGLVADADRFTYVPTVFGTDLSAVSVQPDGSFKPIKTPTYALTDYQGHTRNKYNEQPLILPDGTRAINPLTASYQQKTTSNSGPNRGLVKRGEIRPEDRPKLTFGETMAAEELDANIFQGRGFGNPLMDSTEKGYRWSPTYESEKNPYDVREWRMYPQVSKPSINSVATGLRNDTYRQEFADPEAGDNLPSETQSIEKAGAGQGRISAADQVSYRTRTKDGTPLTRYLSGAEFMKEVAKEVKSDRPRSIDGPTAAMDGVHDRVQGEYLNSVLEPTLGISPETVRWNAGAAGGSGRILGERPRETYLPNTLGQNVIPEVQEAFEWGQPGLVSDGGMMMQELADKGGIGRVVERKKWDMTDAEYVPAAAQYGPGAVDTYIVRKDPLANVIKKRERQIVLEPSGQGPQPKLWRNETALPGMRVMADEPVTVTRSMQADHDPDWVVPGHPTEVIRYNPEDGHFGRPVEVFDAPAAGFGFDMAQDRAFADRTNTSDWVPAGPRQKAQPIVLQAGPQHGPVRSIADSMIASGRTELPDVGRRVNWERVSVDPGPEPMDAYGMGPVQPIAARQGTAAEFWPVEKAGVVRQMPAPLGEMLNPTRLSELRRKARRLGM